MKQCGLTMICRGDERSPAVTDRKVTMAEKLDDVWNPGTMCIVTSIGQLAQETKASVSDVRRGLTVLKQQNRYTITPDLDHANSSRSLQIIRHPDEDHQSGVRQDSLFSTQF